MRSRWRARGDDRQDRQSPYLAEAIKYLTKNTQRPLWPRQRKTTNGLSEEPHPLYPPLTNSRASFITSLNCAFKEYFPSPPRDGRLLRYNNEAFLAWFAERLNTPDPPACYKFVTNCNGVTIQDRIRTSAESLAV